MAELVRRALVASSILAAALLASCSQEKPACAPESLALIELQYQQEALRACAGQSFDECPDMPAVREKYRVLRQQWIDCGP